MSRLNVLWWSVAVAVSGFLFGFDTAVISGADQPIQQLWNHSDLFHGLFIMSMALWGTVLGSLTGGIPCDRLGRKRTLFWIGILYLVSALGSALAPDPYLFSFARFIGGIGVGASSVAAPTYISEIAPPERRGRLVMLYQFNIVLGIVIAYLSNYWLGSIGANAWRWMLGVEVIPAIIYLILVLRIPESPRWLVLKRGDLAAARAVLQRILPSSSAEEALRAIQQSDTTPGSKAESLFSGKYGKLILLAFLIAMFNQLSGINFVIYYAPRIFEMAGLDSSSALLSTTGIGLINLAFTMLGLYLIDRSGRKRLMLIGSLGYIVSLGLVANAFFNDASGWQVPVFLCAFIAAHAIGQGAVIWVFIAEIFPNSVRANGQAFGTGTHWVFAAIITLLMPYVLNQFNAGPIFTFFAGMMVLQLLFVWWLMPETKGVSLEALQAQLLKKKP